MSYLKDTWYVAAQVHEQQVAACFAPEPLPIRSAALPLGNL